MTKGRKRLPTPVKKRRGTLRPHRENPDEPQFDGVQKIPDPPAILSDLGKEVYTTTINSLVAEGVLTKISLPVLVMYVSEVARYYDAIEKINEAGAVLAFEGPTGRKLSINPYHKIAIDALQSAVRIACEYGITPASQSKVHSRKEQKAGDEFDEIMNQ